MPRLAAALGCGRGWQGAWHGRQLPPRTRRRSRLPLGNWLAKSLTGRTIDFFGLSTVPALPVGAVKGLGGTVFDAHAADARKNENGKTG